MIGEETAIHAVKRRPKGWVGPLALPTPSQGGPISQVHASAFTHKAGSPPLICEPSSHINFAQPPVSWSASALRPLHSLLVTQSCLTLCDRLDCNPSGSSVHGVLQARQEYRSPFPSPGDISNPGIELGSPALQANSLPSEPPGKLVANI